jgi:hypothetical protein
MIIFGLPERRNLFYRVRHAVKIRVKHRFAHNYVEMPTFMSREST